MKESPENVQSSEPVPAYFPIIEAEKSVYFSIEPDAKEDVIVHYLKQGIRDKEKLHRFKLIRVIDGLHYDFLVWQSSTDSYGFLYETEEYEYATTNLSKIGREVLAKTISSFLESVAKYKNILLDNIYIDPASAAYSAEQIEECKKAILASPKNKHTPEKIDKFYKGYEIFDLYYKLFGEDFGGEHYNTKSKMKARSRYFKSMAKKYLPGWEVDDSYGGPDFYLKRKTQKE